MINKEYIEAYFKKIEDDGWTIKRKEKDRHTWWCAMYTGGSFKKEVYVVLDSQWLYFQLPLNITISLDCKSTLHYYLLRLNDRIFNAKFSIDEENKIILMTELPLRIFDFTLFNDVLKALVTVADKYSREIEILAQDTRVAGLVSRNK